MSFSSVICQNRNSLPYKIYGSVNVDSGSVALVPVANENLYPESFKTLETTINNGRFEFAGEIPFPLGYYIIIDEIYMSDLVVVYDGDQRYEINIENNRQVPQVEGRFSQEFRTYNEYFKETLKARESYYRLRDSLESKGELSKDQQEMLNSMLEKSYQMHDSTLLKFTTDHPSSFLGLWKFAQLTKFGYQPIFEDIMNSLDKNVQSTYAGKHLNESLISARRTSVGSSMPPINANNMEGKPLEKDYFSMHRYTLIDFWYESCAPCIAQFPYLKELYEKYQSQGFNIIGISTDRTEQRSQLLERIKEQNLPWPQYWDENGLAANELGIHAYPSSFLVDNDGNIVLVNVRHVALAEFLQKTLE